MIVSITKENIIQQKYLIIAINKTYLGITEMVIIRICLTKTHSKFAQSQTYDFEFFILLQLHGRNRNSFVYWLYECSSYNLTTKIT